jgi:hypothetical protein
MASARLSAAEMVATCVPVFDERSGLAVAVPEATIARKVASELFALPWTVLPGAQLSQALIRAVVDVVVVFSPPLLEVELRHRIVEMNEHAVPANVRSPALASVHSVH